MTRTLDRAASGTTRGLLFRLVPPGLYAGRSHALVERAYVVNRRAWLAVVSGFFEPLFFLLSHGFGFGRLVGTGQGPAGPLGYA
ncbi:ABC transporter, partial [Saccharothrix sp. MB29]|nr:ABC transporter [Saccharothrix sp. MB29]